MHIRKHFKIHFPIIDYTVLYAEMTTGKRTKTYTYGGKTYSEVISLSEYLAAISYALLKDVESNKNIYPPN